VDVHLLRVEEINFGGDFKIIRPDDLNIRGGVKIIGPGWGDGDVWFRELPEWKLFNTGQSC